MPSRPTLRRLLVATAATAFAAVTVLGSAAQATHPPQPASITVDSITSAIQPPEGTPAGAVPYVLVKAGDQFSIHVSFHTKNGAPAAFTRDTTLTIATNTGAGNPPGAGHRHRPGGPDDRGPHHHAGAAREPGAGHRECVRERRDARHLEPGAGLRRAQ